MNSAGFARSGASGLSLLCHRLWTSPTFTTWASLGTRTLSLVLVLPLVLRQFHPSEMALWQVFSTLIGLQLLADLGFNYTFSRFIAYAMAGAPDLQVSDSSSSEPRLEPEAQNNTPNWELLSQITATMRFLYDRIGLFFGIALATAGSLALQRRVEALRLIGASDGHSAIGTTAVQAWIGWSVIVFSSYVNLKGNAFASLLQGTNHIPLVRRWEAVFGLGSIASSLLVLSFGGGLLQLVIANQVWVILTVLRNRHLCRRVLGGRLADFPPPDRHPRVWKLAWESAWRSAVGIFMSFGLVQISGLLYAQSTDSTAVASYLLAVRLVQTINTMSTAPFYSKLPVFARLWAEGNKPQLVALARRSMTISYWAFVGPFVLAGLMLPWGLTLIESKTPLPDAVVWGLLGAATLAERYGVMNLLLYSSTNKIVWHVANGVSGVIFTLVACASYPALESTAIPLGMLCGNLGFYAWYSSRLSHRTFALRWPGFDLATVGLPALCLGVYLVALAVLDGWR